jgi:FkbM family methyltransferase
MLRSIPNWMPGKTRIARLALKFRRTSDPAVVIDNYGNRLYCLNLDEPIAKALFAFGIYEPDTLHALLADLPQGGVVLDVGANIGALALPLGKLRPDARIICIEGAPEVLAVLRRNAAANAGPNVHVEGCLVGASAIDAVPFYLAPTHSFGMGSVGPQFDATPILLRQRTLDDILDELGIEFVDRVKIDIEGAELGALAGLSRRLKGPRAPVVVFEFNDWAEARIPGQAPGDAQRLLTSLGYRLHLLGSHGAFGPELAEPLLAGGAMIVAHPPAA